LCEITSASGFSPNANVVSSLLRSSSTLTSTKETIFVLDAFKDMYCVVIACVSFMPAVDAASKNGRFSLLVSMLHMILCSVDSFVTERMREFVIEGGGRSEAGGVEVEAVVLEVEVGVDGAGADEFCTLCSFFLILAIFFSQPDSHFSEFTVTFATHALGPSLLRDHVVLSILQHPEAALVKSLLTLR